MKKIVQIFLLVCLMVASGLLIAPWLKQDEGVPVEDEGLRYLGKIALIAVYEQGTSDNGSRQISLCAVFNGELLSHEAHVVPEEVYIGEYPPKEGNDLWILKIGQSIYYSVSKQELEEKEADLQEKFQNERRRKQSLDLEGDVAA